MTKFRKEILADVKAGNIAPDEVWQMYVKDWSDEAMHIFMCDLIASTIVGGIDMNERQRVERCFEYLEAKKNEAAKLQQAEQSPQMPVEFATDGAKKAFSKGRRGRPNRNFITLVKDQSQTDAVMQCLTALMQGKSGKSAALLIYTAVKIGMIDRPTHPEFISAFAVGDMSKTTYNQYIPASWGKTPPSFSEVEIEGTAAALRQKLDEIRG